MEKIVELLIHELDNKKNLGVDLMLFLYDFFTKKENKEIIENIKAEITTKKEVELRSLSHGTTH